MQFRQTQGMMMKLRFLPAASILLAALSGAALAAGAAGQASPAPPAAPAAGAATNAAGADLQAAPVPAPRIPYEKYTLPNGLEVIMVEDHRLPIVAVNIWYHVGPANEAPGLTGFAHLFEHMMFAGSKHLPRGLADRLLEGAGATDSNGSTDYDRTNYYDTVPSNRLALALWIHADRMGYLPDVLDQAALSNQQDVVRNERRQSVENRPYGLAEEALNHALFPKGHPYYASVIGSHADIQAARLPDVRSFFERFYGPENASLVIAGDIDKAATRALVKKYFGSLRRGPPVARPRVATPPIASERRVTVPGRIELPRVYMAWLTPPAYQPGDADLMVLAQILAGGKSSRLYKSLVYEHQLAQEANANQNSYALASTFVVDATARPGRSAHEIEAALDHELAALRDFGPSEKEVERARNTIITTMLASIEKLGDDGLANLLNRYNQYTGDPGYLPRDLARIAHVSARDVQRAARAWLQPRARVVVAAVPGTPAPTADVPAPPAPPQPRTREAGINRDEPWRAKPPKPGPPPHFALPAGDSFRLSNGLTVIHHYDPALPLVAADLVVRSGSDANPADEPGLAGFTAQVLEEGTATRSAPQIADEIAQLGAFLASGSSADASTVSLLSLRPNFGRALDVLADVVQHPAFPTAEVERQRASRLGALTEQRDDPGAVAAVASYGALYGPDHPYGYGQLGTEPAIRAVTRDDLYQFWRHHYLPQNAALVVCGDITRAELKALAEAHFGGWRPAGEQGERAPGKPETTDARLVVVDMPGAPQTALRVTAIGAARDTPQYPALEVLNAALGGLFSSRINQVLREEKGYSYGMSSGFRYDRTPGPFAVTGSVRTDVTGPSVAEILRQLQGMRDKPMGAQELAGARDAKVLSLPGMFETIEGTAAALGDTFVFGLGPGYYRTLPASFARVTAASAQAAARKYLDPQRMVVVAVGDRRRIAPQLGKLGLGAPQLRDSDGQLPR